VKRLAELGADLTLVTFEKPNDFKQPEMDGIRASLDSNGVKWIPLRYHKRPKVPATAFDYIQGCARSLVSQLGRRPDVIHARTFVGGLMGMAVASVLRSTLIYHNEGFYPDEQVDAGVWKVNSPPHRIAKFLERRLYSRADAIIALSSKAKIEIENIPGVRRKKTTVIVVPSCVDLDHFRWNPPEASPSAEPLRLVYIGSLGGRYNLERVGRFCAAVSSEVGKTELRILTKSDPALAAEMLASTLPREAWSVDTVPYRSMPEALSHQHAGVHFLPRGLSEHGGSPTKIGEYWAAGLPVVVTAGVGDTDEIIRRERVGVIVDDDSDATYRRAAHDLRSLLAAPDIAERCRRAAETHYSLEPACERQFDLYQALTSQAFGPTAGTCASELGKF
jgi:glycosyltransferase involved in cell wall biosynthesis